MSKNKLYAILLLATLTGYLYFIYILLHHTESSTLHLCMIKNTTGFPCPSCGTTRAILLLLKNKWIDSLLVNPLGILVLPLVIIIPFWILLDIVLKKDSFYIWYKKCETIIRTRWIATVLIILVLLNWIWNIYKHL